jgi:hypothetical protein
MPNLHDVIELKKPVTSTTVEKTTKDFLSQVNDTYGMLSKVGTTTAKVEFLQKAQEYLAGTRGKVFQENLSLPEDLRKPVELVTNREGVVVTSVYTRVDGLGYLSGLPQSSMARIRRTADMLGMIVMPYGALDKRSLSNESYEVRNRVSLFVSSAQAASLELYVVAPLRLYNIEQHISLVEGGDDLYSSAHEATLATISLQLPLFRSMFAAVSALDSRVTALEDTNTKVRAQIAALTTRLASLEEKVEESRRVAYEAQKEAERAVAEAQAARQSTWSAIDPLIFATPLGSKLATGDASVLVGPVWGPDFSQVLLEVCGLKIVKGQRKKVEDLYRNSR